MPGPFFLIKKMENFDEMSSVESVSDNRAVSRGAGDEAGLDAQLWHACAGSMVHLPEVGSKVIYFPQGHAEHAAMPPKFPVDLVLSSTIPCSVLSVKFLADIDTDEVHACIRLMPDPSAANLAASDDVPVSSIVPEKTLSFAKTLTQSDANNGGGFSVPRCCADTIFPRLDYSVDPPVQIVHAKDVHGVVWKFRHIYRGTPRRHLLTTGWSNFVNQKKLVAGDAIVFLRSSTGELCMGVRRSTTRGSTTGSSWHHSAQSRWELKPPEAISYQFQGRNGSIRDAGDSIRNFARNQSRISAKSVVEAATLAAAGQPFDVVYYPRASISEFCVKAQLVRSALQQNWGPGMRIKMAVETEDASRISWFMGTILKVQEADAANWPGSPWKMLQITWDEPDLLQGIVRVSPWQVESVSSVQSPPFSLPKKKVRLSQPSELQLDGQGIMGFSLASSVFGHINPTWHGFTDNAPAGMQGVRHDQGFGLLNLSYGHTILQPSFFVNNSHHLQELTNISTELNMGGFMHKNPSDAMNHSRQLVAGCSSNFYEAAVNCDVPKSRLKTTPFLLFGKAIEPISASTISDLVEHKTVSDCDKADVLARDSTSNEPKPSSEVQTLSWFKEQPNILEKDQIVGVYSFNHCKVFLEGDEVGRTLDLSSVHSYDELYIRLAAMFSVEKWEVLSRVFCEDIFGSLRSIGDVPYRDFMKRAKRLKIVSDRSSESL